MPLEILQPAVLQRPLVRRLEHDARGLAGRKEPPASGRRTGTSDGRA